MVASHRPEYPTRFDPPIEVKIPNSAGLKRGETQTILQWDHDLSAFVPMGHGTVSEDGSQIVTDAGTGISKAGWGGGPPPTPPNCATNAPPDCTECEEIDSSGICPRCVPKLEDVRATTGQCRGSSCRLCRNNACRKCKRGKCTELYNDQIPDGVNKFTYTDPTLDYISISGLPNSYGSFHGYENDSLRAAAATWTFNLAAYCTPEGNWKFRLVKAEIDTTIVKNTDATPIEVDTAVIDNNQFFSFCSHYSQIEFGLRFNASTHYPRAPLGGNPVLNCMTERLGWFHFDNYNNWLGTLNHEKLHFTHFQEYMDVNFINFKSDVESLVLPIVENDTPESAVASIKAKVVYTNTINRLINSALLTESIVRPNNHVPFEGFYRSEVDTPEYVSIFQELERRRVLRQCFYIPDPDECRILQ